MKKRNLKSLKLNKKSISNLESNAVKGGDIFTIVVTVQVSIDLGYEAAEALVTWYYDCNE